MTMINEQKKVNQFPQHPLTTPPSISRRSRLKGDHPLRPNSCHVTSKAQLLWIYPCGQVDIMHKVQADGLKLLANLVS